MKKKSLELTKINSLIDQGLNCKQIAKYFGYSQTWFCEVSKKFLKEYLSIYISKRRKLNASR